MDGLRSRASGVRLRSAFGTGIVTVLLAITLGGGRAQATIRLYDLGVGKLELSGNLQSQNLIRHRSARDWQSVQQRNVIRTRVDWELLRVGKLFGKFRVPGLRKSKLFLLYRGVYDSIYDTTPDVHTVYDARGDNLRARFATALNPREVARLNRSLTLDGLPQNERDSFKFENSIREVYVDLKFRKVPLSLRIGKQQIVWGETDNFRMLDRVNPLDTTWHLYQELPPPMFGWDEIRRPLFMVKGLYDLGTVGPVSQAFLEAYWNPGDWYPVKVAFLPRPWGIPLLDPLTNPWDGAYTSLLCAQAPDRRCTRLMKGTRFFQQGNYDRWNPLDNSQLGIRFHGQTPQGVEFTLNYLHQRWAGDDGTNSAPVKGLRVFNTRNPSLDPASRLSTKLLNRGVFPIEFFAPYVNTVGFSANYSDETYTQAVFRLETIVDIGIPFFDLGKRTTVDSFLPGVTERNMWKGMLGFDRPTWIHWLNNKTTVFFTGQWFWHYLINNPECPSDIRVGRGIEKLQNSGGHCLTGSLDLPSEQRPISESYRDKIRDWETLVTLAAFTFYRGGSVVPVVGYALDPVNSYSSEFFWTVDYFVTPTFAFNIAQKYFIAPAGLKANFETWGLNSFSRGRSETSLRVTYNF